MFATAPCTPCLPPRSLLTRLLLRVHVHISVLSDGLFAACVYVVDVFPLFSSLFPLCFPDAQVMFNLYSAYLLTNVPLALAWHAPFGPTYFGMHDHISFYEMVSVPRCLLPYNYRKINANVVQTDDAMQNNSEQA